MFRIMSEFSVGEFLSRVLNEVGDEEREVTIVEPPLRVLIEARGPDPKGARFVYSLFRFYGRRTRKPKWGTLIESEGSPICSFDFSVF